MEKIISMFIVSFIVSTFLIRWGIPKLKPETKPKDADVASESTVPIPQGDSQAPIFDYRASGFWIGFFETLLVFTFVCQEQYGALAIIIGAKQIVRKEKIEENPSYYLLGTLVNVSIALLFALIART